MAMTAPMMSILRSGEMLPKSEVGGAGSRRADERAGWYERVERRAGLEALPRAPSRAVREEPERLFERAEDLREVFFERVIGMAKELYCFLSVF
jgi:hypothetical protein